MLICRVTRIALASLAFSPVCGEADSAPVTTRTDAAGLLLQQWFDDGLAAGHEGDFYDNRDGGHSRLDLSKYPQLLPLSYSSEEVEKGKNYGLPDNIRSVTVLGNASLAGSAESGASIPRLYYRDREGVNFLMGQYLGNQLYVYPEHEDHDPSGEGKRGWGDLYPLNSPCLVISQGSSFSDLPFLDAFAMTLASFKPDVKKALRDQRLICPVVQQIFRTSLKPVETEEDYLSGIAHPSVFPAEWIDEMEMMRRAQEMTRETLPPVLLLELVEESPVMRPGIDFFEEPGRDSESL